MIIHWKPCGDPRGQHEREYTQPTPDVVGIGPDEVDLSDPNTVEWPQDVIPEAVSRWLLRAWRDGSGTLHVELVAFFRAADRGVWERRPFRGTEGEDYGTRGSLSWRDFDPRA
jgi:hypothetical protein